MLIASAHGVAQPGVDACSARSSGPDCHTLSPDLRALVGDSAPPHACRRRADRWAEKPQSRWRARAGRGRAGTPEGRRRGRGTLTRSMAASGGSTRGLAQEREVVGAGDDGGVVVPAPPRAAGRDWVGVGPRLGHGGTCSSGYPPKELAGGRPVVGGGAEGRLLLQVPLERPERVRRHPGEAYRDQAHTPLAPRPQSPDTLITWIGRPVLSGGGRTLHGRTHPRRPVLRFQGPVPPACCHGHRGVRRGGEELRPHRSADMIGVPFTIGSTFARWRDT
jgi:hypothetical protein